LTLSWPENLISKILPVKENATKDKCKNIGSAALLDGEHLENNIHRRLINLCYIHLVDIMQPLKRLSGKYCTIWMKAHSVTS
jgi:hypothetical protein